VSDAKDGTETYDYVIVGAGTAGSVVASRLSEQAGVRVLVLEAGGSDRTLWIQLPIGYGRTYFDRSVNWMYDSEPEPALNGRESYWPRGKVIGGSGSINAMVHVRGRPEDFDDWRNLGNPGWGFDDVLPFFRRSEDFDGPMSDWRAQGGPQHVTDITDRAHPLCRVFVETGQALGFPATLDFNGPAGEGVGIYQINTRNGFRASTANEYLRPALRRGNLRLVTQARATRVLFEGHRAVGVEYDRGGVRTVVKARREVVLCGGSVATPQLLQLSGIGDGAHLASLGINAMHHLPAVGRNLQDHLAVSYFYKSNRPTLNDALRPLSGKILAGMRYLLDRGGPLSLSVNQGGGFIRSRPELTRPDLQLYFSPVSYTQTPLSERRLLNPDPFSAFLLSFNACRPTSRGEIMIRSADPFAAPAIRPNYLSTDQDVADAIAGSRLLRQIAATAPLCDIITDELVPGRHVQSDAELLADFRDRADTVYHPVSTCRMGPDATTSSVDARLCVHGFAGLRVVDASIFPTITSGNTNAPTVMVAEKGAALIREDAAR
jgi:choline dehydrogenase